MNSLIKIPAGTSFGGISSVALRVRLAGSLEQGTKDSDVWFVWPL